jgi:large subunit ribosomal protein L11
MPKETIEVLVEGGKATAAPPLGPALGPMGVNITAVVDAINDKTKGLAGMQVPVKVIVDTSSKAYEIQVGTPPVSALIKKELGLEKGSVEPGKAQVGRMTPAQANKVAEAKFGSTDPRYVEQIKGTARSMGIDFGAGELTEDEKKAFEEAQKMEARKEEEKPAEGEEAKEEGEEVPEGEESEEKEETKDDDKK